MEGSKQNSKMITIENYEMISLNGVEHIVQFDEGAVVLSCDFGKIVVEGEGMKIESLDKIDGKIIIKGKFRGLYFAEKKATESFFKRIFK